MSTDLAALVQRLEAVTAKLEGVALGTPAASGDGGSCEGMLASVEAFDALCQMELAAYLQCAKALEGEIAAHGNLVAASFAELRSLLVLASQSKQPAAGDMALLLRPLSEAMVAASEFKALKANMRTKFPSHLATVCEGVPALGWVSLDAKPAPFVKEMADAAEFYANRVLKDFKDVDSKHVKWVRSVKALWAALHDYVKQWHTTGLTWNPKGGVAQVASGAPAAAQPAAPVAPPPSDVAQKPAAGNLFAELAKGTAVTAGLKKVDKSQMTHKNPELRASSVVKTAAAKAPSTRSCAKVGGPPKCELEGKRWAVEWQQDNENITLDDAEMSQTVYIYKCRNSVVKINKKVNSIVMDDCHKVAVVFASVVASFEAVNCQRIQVQVLNMVPTINLDKTDGAQVYLSKEALAVEILTAKCSEVNIVVPPKTEDEDMVEHPLPEQFKTRYNPDTSKFVTENAEVQG